MRPVDPSERGTGTDTFLENWIYVDHVRRPRVLAQRSIEVYQQLLESGLRQGIEQENHNRCSREHEFRRILADRPNLAARPLLAGEPTYVFLSHGVQFRYQFDAHDPAEWILRGQKQSSPFARPNVEKSKLPEIDSQRVDDFAKQLWLHRLIGRMQQAEQPRAPSYGCGGQGSTQFPCLISPPTRGAPTFVEAGGQGPGSLAVDTDDTPQISHILIPLKRSEMPRRVGLDVLIVRGLVGCAPQHARSLGFAAVRGHLRGEHSQERMRIGHLRAAHKSTRRASVVLQIHVVNKAEIVIEMPVTGIIANAILN